MRTPSSLKARISTRLAILCLGLGTFAGFAAPSLALEKMDSETHTIVIEKLENVLAKAKEDDSLSMRPIRARLADLYSERARLRSMDEAEKNCQDCPGARDDRARALVLYETVIKEAPQASKGPLMMHKAHLHELQNEAAKASKIYDQIIASGEKEYGRDVTAQAYSGRGEVRFAKGEFGKAKPDFEASMRLSPAERRGNSMYRIAWCELNLGDQPRAVRTLSTLLRSREMLTRVSTGGPQFDASFQEDVSRDFASFLARGAVSRKEIDLLVSLSPAQAKRENIRYLAKECERLGAPPAALIAWDAFIETDAKPDDRLEAMIHTASIRMQMNRKDEAVKTMLMASNHWNKFGCKEDAGECDNMRANFRKIPIEWNRAEKKKPTQALLAAYKAYLAHFDKDVEMTHWAALVARELKSSREAAALFDRASTLASDALAQKISADGTGRSAEAEDVKTNKDILEASLIGSIEMSEQAKDPALRAAAYQRYLALDANGPKAVEVRYQLARIPYEAGNNAVASDRLFEFATSNQCRALASGTANADSELCVKAADLDLDALAQLKQDAKIENHATGFAGIYASRRAEYSKIARKSALNQVSKTSNNVQADNSDVKDAMAKLKGVSLVGASSEDQIAYWKNRIKLAERARDLGEVSRSADGLLSAKGLSKDDREYALERKEWASEMQLDFASAYRVSQKMDMPKLGKDDRELRLALLAELSGANPKVHEERFLTLAHDRQKAMEIRAKLVRDARNPEAELRKQGRDLESHPSLYAPLALEIFARTQDYAFAEHAVKVRGVAQLPAGQTLQRYLFMRDFGKLQKTLAAQRIRTNTDAALGKTLTERVKMVGLAEDYANRAIRSRDWTLELATLATVSHENQRLYDDILRLPLPRTLRGPARARYVTLIAAKAKPYKDKHDQIELKLAGFWNDSQAIENAARAYQNARHSMRPLLAKDIQAISKAAPVSVSRQLKEAITAENRTLKQDLASARGDVQRQPFDARSLQHLRELEEQDGRDSMVTHLDARLLQLKQGERR